MKYKGEIKNIVIEEIQRKIDETKQRICHINEKGMVASCDDQFLVYLEKLLSFVKNIKEEPASEDLEKEIDNYIKDNFFGSETYGFCSNRTGGELDCVDVVNIARHFANWQKEQMMNGAIELPLYLDGDFLTIDYDFTESGFKVGDKVKLIIIKED